MTAIQLVACIGLIIGAFLLLDLAPIEFSDGLFGFLTKQPRSIRDEINETDRRKKPFILRREIMEARDILALTGHENRFSLLCALSLLMFAVGASVAILLDNGFLVPVLSVGFMLLPFWYVKMTASHYKKNVAAELETALSIITTAYLRNEDILTAVEENVHYLNQPVKNVFAGFLNRMKLVSPDIDAALKDMKPKINNDVFHEWCDAIAACQYDRSLKTTLTSIVAKLSDIRIVNAELDYLIVEPRKEFIIMVLMVAGSIPVMYLLNKGWYDTLMHTIVGQLILMVCAAAIFISTAFVLKLTRPIEYRR